MAKATEFKFEVKETYGVISEGSKGWKTEVNAVSWNEKEPKIDIRSWDENHEKMGKGISFTKEEAKSLRDILNKMDID